MGIIGRIADILAQGIPLVPFVLCSRIIRIRLVVLLRLFAPLQLGLFIDTPIFAFTVNYTVAPTKKRIMCAPSKRTVEMTK